MTTHPPRLKLLPRKKYDGVNEYDPLIYYYLPIFGRMYRRRVELALGECREGQRVLEVGFGAGVTFINLSEMFEEIHGIDLTANVEIIESVFEPMNLPLFLQKGDVLNIPYEKNYFDTVLLISILEHLKAHELEQTFNEVRRVLKPGGRIVTGEMWLDPDFVAPGRLRLLADAARLRVVRQAGSWFAYFGRLER